MGINAYHWIVAIPLQYDFEYREFKKWIIGLRPDQNRKEQLVPTVLIIRVIKSNIHLFPFNWINLTRGVN